MRGSEVELRCDDALGSGERHMAVTARLPAVDRAHQKRRHPLRCRLHRAGFEIDEEAVNIGTDTGEQAARKRWIVRDFRVYELTRNQQELRIRQSTRFRARSDLV